MLKTLSKLHWISYIEYQHRTKVEYLTSMLHKVSWIPNIQLELRISRSISSGPINFEITNFKRIYIKLWYIHDAVTWNIAGKYRAVQGE